MLTLRKPAAAKRKPARRARPVASERIQIFEGETLVGNIYIDVLERVLKHDGAIPKDVVLKALFLYTRHGQLSGETTSRETGRAYAWDVNDEDEW